MTDDTAKEILATPQGEEHWGFCEAGIKFDDLREMATFWLAREDLQRCADFGGFKYD